MRIMRPRKSVSSSFRNAEVGCRVTALLAALFLFFTFSASARAQETAKRLILKDGSYQMAAKYEVKGDRVRYYSTEREEWEELPNSLIDWPATEKYEKDRAASASAPAAVQLDKEAEAESERNEREEKPLPEVARGLRLPEDTGVFLLDSFQNEPQLVEVQQTAGDVGHNAKGNVFKAAIAGVKETIELRGAHAAVQSHVAVPSFYISADAASDSSQQAGLVPDRAESRPSSQSQPQSQSQPEQPEQPIVPFDKFRIIRADVKNGNRIVGDVKRSPTGKISQEQHFVKTTITNIAGGWLKLTPTEDMAPGEYALVEMMGKEGMNLYVWDFGVNPKAPVNANSWKPETKTAEKPKADAPSN
jgi:hypothetical protein